jgi:hypothetical protein
MKVYVKLWDIIGSVYVSTPDLDQRTIGPRTNLNASAMPHSALLFHVRIEYSLQPCCQPENHCTRGKPGNVLQRSHKRVARVL